MTLLQAIRERLLAQTAVTTLVEQRVYVMRLPENGVLPAIRLTEIDRESFMHSRGVTGLYRSRIQVDQVALETHSDPYASVHAIAAAVRGDYVAGVPTGLAGFKGTLSGVLINGILAVDQRERYESGVKFVKVETDYMVWHRL